MTAISSARVRLRSIALPIEHGGWAFLIEPLFLGLLLVPSWAGIFCGLAAFGVFLLYQPLQLMFKDRRRGKRYPRTIWAERFVALYAAVILVGGLGILLISPGSVWHILSVILAATPFACIQMLLVVRGYSKAALTEICGAIALGATLPAILISGGWTMQPAFTFWLIPAARAVTSILYVRTRLRLARTTASISKWPPMLAHISGVLLIGFTVYAGALPMGSLIALLILSGRALYGLYFAPRNVPARVIGFQELGYGIIVLLLAGLSYRM